MYDKLKKEELIAALEERDAKISELQEAGDQALIEENEALRESIKELQEENRKLSGRELKAPIIKIDGAAYYLNAKQINYKGSVINASDLIENPDGKFNEVLELLVKKGSGLIKPVEE